MTNKSLKSNKTTPKEKAMLVVEGKETIGIQFIDTEYLFDKRKGLVSIQVNDEEILKQAPKPIFYRALTDNDRGAKQTYANWLNASLFQNVVGFKMIRNSKCAQMIYTIQLESIEEECKLVYTVYNNQSIQIQLHLDKKLTKTNTTTLWNRVCSKRRVQKLRLFWKRRKRHIYRSRPCSNRFLL